MKSLSKRAISLILAVLMIMDVFAPVAVVASSNSPQNNVKVLDEEPESETNSQNNEILIPATPQTNPEEDTLVPVQDPASKPSQNSSQKPAQKPAQNKTIPNQLYKSWTLVNPGKTTYSKGDILDLSKLSVRVTKTDGTVATLSYVQLLKDTNFDVIENVGNKINLQPGKGTVTLVGPNLNPITINIVVNDSTDKLQGANSNDELVPAIDPQANEENDELVVAENPNDKKTNIIEGNEQNSPEKDKQTEEKLEEEAIKGSILDQVAGKETEVNPLGLKSFDPLKALGLNKEDRELTEEELEAGLTKVELPTLNEAPVSPVFARSTYQSTGLIGDANLKEDLGLDMSDEIVPEAVGAGNTEDPQNLLQLDGKKFNIRTNFQTKVANGPIRAGQYFKIKLDDKLTLKDQFSLQPIKYNGQVIATAKYNAADNTITYKLIADITADIRVPVNIPVDYNTKNITPDENGNFVVTNKVSGLGVINPKDFNPKKVNKFGNVTNQITEPGRKEVTEIIESGDKEHKVYLEEWSTPVIEDKNLVGFNWTFTVTSDIDLNSLGYRANFTTVKGSGLGEIKDVKINGQDVELTDQLQNGLGIVDSKHHALESEAKGITYTFYTEVTDKQSAYMVDFSLALTAQNKVGAKRCIADEGYSLDDIAVATTSRVGMNNRTTILGEFPIIDGAKWTVTDAVSTGDNNEILPLEQRTLGGDQSQTGTQIAVYKLNSDGQMVEDKAAEETIRATEAQETYQVADQPVGTIAAYVYDTAINKDENQPEAKKELTLGGVEIAINAEPLVDDSLQMEGSLEVSGEKNPQAVGAGQGRSLLEDEKEKLDNKKFNIRTIFQTSNINGPIKAGQFFRIHLDNELTVKQGTTLEPIKYNNEVIATPKYNSTDNTITYTITKDIPNSIQVPLNIPVDYNTANITLDEFGNFTVINKVSGLGVTNPKALLPEKIDKNGNPAGTIIEPGSNNVLEIVDQGKDYKVYMDAKGNPIVENGKLVAIDWQVKFSSNVDLLSLGLVSNATLVKGSGLGKFENILLNDGQVSMNDLSTNDIEGKFGIIQSKNHKLSTSMKEAKFNFRTKVTNVQSQYMIDLSVALQNRQKTGAVRLLYDNGFDDETIKESTSKRVGMNNRTTILGEFASDTTAKWTVTDGVSTGDTVDGFPLATRNLSGDQTLTSSKVAVYGLNPADGKMVVKQDVTDLNNTIPSAGTNPQGTQLPGRIAVYEFDTNIKESEKGYSLAGVNINKYQDLKINQTWAGITSDKKMPAQGFEVQDQAGTKLKSFNVDEGQPGVADRKINLPRVKYWNIDNTGKETRINHKVVQNLPPDTPIDGKTYSYKEKYNSYTLENKAFQIYNIMQESTDEKAADFTILKTDGKTNAPLAGAKFTLQSPKETIELVTDSNGRASFSNVSPGTYTLIENKAPEGYKIDQSAKQIVVSQTGSISVTGNNIVASGGTIDTETAHHQYYPRYASYMNSMHYGSVDQNGKIVSYIYLKPESNDGGNGTDKNTRLNLNLYGGTISKVEVIDVAPGNRSNVLAAMQNQTASSVLGSDVQNKNVANDITGENNVKEDFTGKTGYQIKFPKDRFNGDWGFLVKVTGTKSAGATPTFSYDWLTDNKNVATEARIQTSVGLSNKTSSTDPSNPSGGKEPVILTITNEAFPKAKVQVTKIKEDKTVLANSTFVLKDSKGNDISTVLADANGLADFGELNPGNYTIEESIAPKGYKKSNVIFDVNVAEDGKVTYKARFKDGNGTPINGIDYILEDVEASQQEQPIKVENVQQYMILQEKQSQPADGRLGTEEGIWEAYGIESYRYKSTFTVSNAKKGGRFKIQFDPHLDFKRYVYEMPKLKDGSGNVIAEPYFNYETNLLTYVFTADVQNTVNTQVEIIGIIPDKFYATQTNKTNGYNFTITVDPDDPSASAANKKVLPVNIKTDYYTYDSQGGSGPLTSEYITDVYKGSDGNIYLKAVSYYNPIAESSGPRKLRYDWLSMNRPQPPAIENYRANGYPAFGIDDIKVYKVYGSQSEKQSLMPLSYGIRPEQDPNNYNLVYSKSGINASNQGFSDYDGTYRVEYKPENLKSYERLIEYGHEGHPLEISLPRVKNNEGYVVIQTFKVTDEQRFKDLWSGYYLSQGSRHTASYQKGNYNWAIGSETGQELPKFYTQKINLINKTYTPGSFKIKKTDETDKSKNLKGAVFELRNQAGDVIYRPSDDDGIVAFNDLEPGRYTLKENKAPDGYTMSDKTWQVVVYDSGIVSITEIALGETGEPLNGSAITLPVANKPSGTDFIVYKKDSDGKTLQGAKFKITKQDDTTFTDVEKTSDGNGIVKFGSLTKGTYVIEETAAPAGYNKSNKKWVLVIDDKGNKKVYNYRENSSTASELNSILEKPNVNWVNVAGRSLDGWNLYDNRRTDWYYNYPTPFKMGTRIVAINRDQKYVIQRFVINPESLSLKKTTATIHREKPDYTNMDWYKGDEVYQVFELNKAVTGEIQDMRLTEYGAKEITNQVEKDVDKTHSGQPQRLKLTFPETDKPLVIDVKVPYKEESGGIGTGMDWTENGTTYWKSDYYEKASIIKETDPVVTQSGGIIGSYVSENSLDVTNEIMTYGFKLKKVIDGAETQVIEGATFKLVGPGDSGKEITKTTGPIGIASFDGLKPGTYKLEETEPAPGYEPAKTTWTVTVTKDGKVYYKVNNPDTVNNTASVVQLSPEEAKSALPVSYALKNGNLLFDSLTTEELNRNLAETVLGKNSLENLEIGNEIVNNPVGSGDGWETVDLNKSRGQYYTKTGDGTWVNTWISQVNKTQGKFRQIFEVKDGASSPVFFFRTEPYEGTIVGGTRNTKKTFDFKVNSVKVGGVNKSWKDAKFFEYNNGGKTLTGYQIKLDGYQDGKTVIEVEYSYPQTGEAGMGMEFKPYSASPIKYASQRFTDAKYVNIDVKKEYNITGYTSTGGSVTASPTTSEAGKTITLNVQAAKDYRLKEGSLKVTDANNGNVTVNNNSFTMPASDVTISAEFEKIPETTYSVIINYQENGTVTAKPSQNVKAGNTVTLTLNPNKGYKLKELTVNSTSGPVAYTKVDDTTYTFKMPASNVGINVSYEKQQPESHNINITCDTNMGSVSASPVSAKKGDQVTLTVTPNPGFEIASVSMNGQTLTATNGKYTFKMPDGDVNVTATFKQLDLGTEIPTNGAAIIKNKQTGIELKIAKKDNNGKPLEGAEFTIQEEGGTTILATATSDKDGNVVFVDKDKNPIKLTKGGKYTLTETKAPIGFKKAAAPWHIEVVEVNGQLVIKKSGPQSTTSSFLTSNKNVAADNQTGNIKYKSIVKSIDTTSKTFVQRLYVDTRKYGKTVNLQIKPKHKREEIDRPGLPPVTITEGVKTAYRSTYKITNPGNVNVDDVLNQYDLRQPNVSVVNTARWRPFDWGFDEDILNLEPGVYFIDIEGYYDQSIVDKKVTNEVAIDSNYNFTEKDGRTPSTEPVIKDPYERTDIPDGDLGKIELHFDFYDGARQFQQLYDTGGTYVDYKYKEKGSYQGGMIELRNWVARYNGTTKANYWANNKPAGQKYKNALSKEAYIETVKYAGGKINPSVTGNPAVHVDTSLDISSLYTSDKLETIPQEGMSVTNDKEVYNITFSKHKEGGDDNTNRLEGAVFKLLKKEGSFWIDLDDSYVSSAFNGYFGFRRLEPGSYRLIEVSPPKGYRAIDGTLLEFTINTFDPNGDVETRADGKIYDKKSGLQVQVQQDGTHKVIDPKTGKIIDNANGYVTLDKKQDSFLEPNVGKKDESGLLVDFVTSATAKNIGKVINKEPGKGKVTITKYGDGTTKLKGVEFEATKLSLEKDENGKPISTATYPGKTDNNGVAIIDGLPIGNYELRETKSQPGHINTGQVWHFTVGGTGLDPYANDTSSGGRNLTSYVSLTDSTIKVVQPQQNNKVVDNPKQIFPHSGETFKIENNYKIDPSVKINAGDYFILKLSDNIDLEGIRRGEQDNLDLFADGVGTIAKAKYDKETGTITYTFTKYADQYTLQDFSNTLAAHPTLNRVKNSGWQLVGTSVGTDTSKYKYIYFYYVVDTEYGNDDSGNNINMASKIVSFNSKTGEFVHYFYINREREYSNLNLTFRYQPSAKVSDLKFTKYSLTYNSNYYLYDSMPASFGVDENNSNLVNEGTTSFGDVAANSRSADYIGKFPSDQSMIIKVTGKIDTKNLMQYKGFSGLYFGYTASNGYWYEYPNAYRWDEIYAFGNDNKASADLKIFAVNPTNKIQFKKVDESGKTLAGAKFSLYKNDGTIEKPSQAWTAIGDPKETDTNGLISYEKLEQGLYKLKETTAPTNYIKPTEPVAIFKVDENGKIFKEVTVNKADGSGTDKIFQEVDGNIPIDIINYKAIQFVKIDGDNKEIYLQGARFEVWKKANASAADYGPYKVKNSDGKLVTLTVSSDENGKFSLNITEDGDYALKEVQAPKGYTKIPGYVKEFKITGGKLTVLEKDPLKASFTKGAKGLITGQVLEVDKDNKTFKQRLIVNPGHKFNMDPYGTQFYIRSVNDPLNKNVTINSVKTAVLAKDKSIDDLTTKDYSEFGSTSSSGNILYKQNLRELYKIPYQNWPTNIDVTDALVIEVTGAFTDENPANFKVEMVSDQTTYDEITYNLDINAKPDGPGTYIEPIIPIAIENRKAEYPSTGGMGTFIFTSIGASLIGLAYLSYRRRRGLVIDE